MTPLLLTDRDLDARGIVARASLAPLVESLGTDLDKVLARPLYIPREKAFLSREGGRCPRDATMLEFDPFSPHEHRCPRCGTVYTGELHDRFWIYWYQLWLAERAVHAVLLSRVAGVTRFAPLGQQILDAYADLYLLYPNVDNVLGPTRLFFSTYLESIWLLQICIATRLIERAAPALAARVRDRIIDPSRAIIAEYDEGASNRQVWNNAALFAAAMLLDDHRAADRIAFGESGIAWHLTHGLLDDGTWYEGENYHLFAHRGLWYGVTMAEAAGLEIPGALLARFQLGFSTPFMTALPDFTLPSRRDSQYAISLRQWRIAEHCELGTARRNDAVLRDALRRIYTDDVPRRATGRDVSAADVERNMPPSALDRSDLSWRALLFALPELPPLEASPLRSVLLAGQGIAVFRRENAGTYVALDYGHAGGGHGHPDRLNLLLADGDVRWLDDMGTGSYVERTLHWYRSTLAHNAPLVDGRSQRSIDGQVRAYDERGAAGWIRASAEIASGVVVERTLVVMPDYLVDTVSWRAPAEVTFDLPLHADLSITSDAELPVAGVLAGGSGLEDGFDFVRDTSVERVPAGVTIVARARSADARQLSVWVSSSQACEWWRAVAPGAPGLGDASFRLLRTRGQAGAHTLVWSWTDAVASATVDQGIRIALRDDSVHQHSETDAGWHVELRSGGARSSIDLGGIRTVDQVAPPLHATSTPSRHTIELPASGAAVEIELGEHHYRRSEESWANAGAPRAVVSIRWCASVTSLEVTIDVPHSDRTFAPGTAVNRYDNESPDVNGDGVQLYVRTDRGGTGWMFVPEPDSSNVRARLLDDWRAPMAHRAVWHPTENGYRVTVTLEMSGPPRAIDVIVNEMPRGRERRRGQLVMSRAHGEFAYLRGDRHEADRLIPIRIVDV
jgi:heparinase II/III-like protein